MKIEQHHQCRKHQGIGYIKSKLAQPQKNIQTKNRKHTSAMQQIMTVSRLYYILQTAYMFRGHPDQGIIVIIAMQGHQIIKHQHQQKNPQQNQQVSAQIVLTLGQIITLLGRQFPS